MPWIGMPVDYTELVPATYLIYGIFTYYYRCSITDVPTKDSTLEPAYHDYAGKIHFWRNLLNLFIQHNPLKKGSLTISNRPGLSYSRHRKSEKLPFRICLYDLPKDSKRSTNIFFGHNLPE